MRGTDKRSGELFSYVDLERRVQADHSLRVIRLVVNDKVIWSFTFAAAAYNLIRLPKLLGPAHA